MDAIQAQPASPLLELPAELRNRIYEYALMEPERVYCWPHAWGFYLLPYNSYPPPRGLTYYGLNQMKFVCRQLRQETAFLGPGLCKDLIFTSGGPQRREVVAKYGPEAKLWVCRGRTSEVSVSVDCARFLSGCTAAQLEGVQVSVLEEIPRRVRAFYKRFFDLGGMIMLAQVAQAHPKLSLAVHLSSFVDPPVNVNGIMVGLMLEKALGRETHDQPRLESTSQAQIIDVAVGNMSKIHREYGPDSRFFPKNLTVFLRTPKHRCDSNVPAEYARFTPRLEQWVTRGI